MDSGSSSQHIPNKAGALTPITQSRALALLLLISALPACAAEPFRPPYTCTEDDLQWAGMACSESDPCPVYLEISHVYPLGRKLFATGNIHSAQVTLYSILLASDDGGATWREGVERVRGGELDRIQFTNFDTGWVSGQRVTPLPGDPFLLLTTDGGKSWRRQEVLPEGSVGSIQKFWFDSPRSGSLVMDRGSSDADQMRYSRYESMTGGASWMIRESAEKPLDIPAANLEAENETVRVRGDGAAKRLVIEKRTEGGWVAIGSLALELAQCKGESTPLAPPPTAAAPAAPAKDYVEELKVGPAPGESPVKKKKAEIMRNAAIELELFRNLFVSVAEEMGVVLRKTAFSPNIKERRDYSCAVYDASAETVAMGDHMPVHLGAMPLSVRHAINAFSLGPGDTVILNDPFRGGTHLPDITMVSAVFLAKAKYPAFYVANRAHHSDVGGMSPGSMPLAREIYQEGLRIPPILLVKAGKTDEALLRMILANVRTPREREGDLMAQLMANDRGAVRLRETVARYGLARVNRNMLALKNYSERMTRQAIGRIPDGCYEFADCLDNDGITADPVWIRAAILISGETARVDFTGTDPQAAGCVNANYAVALAAAMYCFRCLLPDQVPYNAGLLRAIEVIAPEGTVVNAQAPAAMAAGNVETSQRITDVLLGALAKALPDLIPAASSGTMNNLTLGGWDAVRAQPFAYYETVAGGMGASAIAPGRSATHAHMTNSWNTPAEAFEHEYPLRIRKYAVRRNSGGRGARDGGDGIIREIEFLASAEITVLADRRERGPYGLAGGQAGAPGRTALITDNVEKTLPGKIRFDVKKSDILRIETPGGGGWGPVKLTHD